MSNDPSSETIYDTIRARGIAVRDFSLSVNDCGVRVGGEVRSYYQAQLVLNIVASAYEGWNLLNNLVVHSAEFDDQCVPQSSAST